MCRIAVMIDFISMKTLREKGLHSEFWLVHFCIRTEYGLEKLRIRTLFTQCLLARKVSEQNCYWQFLILVIIFPKIASFWTGIMSCKNIRSGRVFNVGENPQLQPSWHLQVQS